MQGPNKATEKLAVQNAPKAPKDFRRCCIQVFVSMANAQFVLNFVPTMHIQMYASDWIANDNHKIDFKRSVANAFNFSPPGIVFSWPLSALSLELEIWRQERESRTQNTS